MPADKTLLNFRCPNDVLADIDQVGRMRYPAINKNGCDRSKTLLDIITAGIQALSDGSVVIPITSDVKQQDVRQVDVDAIKNELRAELMEEVEKIIKVNVEEAIAKTIQLHTKNHELNAALQHSQAEPEEQQPGDTTLPDSPLEEPAEGATLPEESASTPAPVTTNEPVEPKVVPPSLVDSEEQKLTTETAPDPAAVDKENILGDASDQQAEIKITAPTVHKGKPLTQTQLAKELEVSGSTLSRSKPTEENPDGKPFKVKGVYKKLAELGYRFDPEIDKYVEIIKAG